MAASRAPAETWVAVACSGSRRSCCCARSCTSAMGPCMTWPRPRPRPRSRAPVLAPPPAQWPPRTAALWEGGPSPRRCTAPARSPRRLPSSSPGASSSGPCRSRACTASRPAAPRRPMARTGAGLQGFRVCGAVGSAHMCDILCVWDNWQVLVKSDVCCQPQKDISLGMSVFPNVAVCWAQARCNRDP